MSPDGHIWFGVTSNDPNSGTAHLYEYDPTTDRFADRGNVVAELIRLGLRRPGERQMKIHSRIVYAVDGYQYFASMDESGEADDGSRPPTWGGHLWRRGPTGAWEHLLSAPEALIAVATGGPYVYALGYFNHVLYQFDTRTHRVRSATVGAIGGHVSRNFFVDDSGHAYVPRVSQAVAGGPTAVLVELNNDLQVAAASPLGEYFDASPEDTHGIVGISPNGRHGWYFVTSKGRLYETRPGSNGPATVTDLGWFDLKGPRYVASMFRDDASGVLYAASQPLSTFGNSPVWIARTPDAGATVAPLPYGTALRFPDGVGLYGSITHDRQDRLYVVGTMHFKPVILQVTPVKNVP